MLRRIAPALAVLALAPPAHAATFEVTSGGDGADPGSGTFRRAILDAAAAPGPDEIVFDEARLVSAAGPLPNLSGPLAVDGRGSLVRGSGVRLGTGVTATALGVEPPFALESAALAPPAGLAVRRLSDGAVRVTGTLAEDGALEVFGAGGAHFLARWDSLSYGPFAVAPEPQPIWDQSLTATVTTAAGTSGFAPEVIPGDLTSPVLAGARTADADGDGLVETLRLELSEPIDDAAGFDGFALAGFPGARAWTGERAGDAELDVVLAAPLDTAASPAVRIAANPAVADAAGNQVLVGDHTVAADAVAPAVRWALATSRTHVRVRFSEPLAGMIVPPSVLTMSGTRRTIVRALPGEDGRTLEIEARPEWEDGAAGEIALDATLGDAAGNRAAATPRTPVWAAPGDHVAPRLTRVRLTARDGRPGGTVRFVLDEPARVSLALRRGRSRARSAITVGRAAGKGRIVLGARVEGRRLVPGRYTVELVARDAAGNRSRRARLTLRVRR